jgi:hypothetical protein
MLTCLIEVGFGLELCVNAAPLLLIELSYPTQVRTTVMVGTHKLIKHV